MSRKSPSHPDETDFLYVTVPCREAEEAVGDVRLLSEILGGLNPVSLQTTPQIPCSAEETILVLGFNKEHDIHRFDEHTCDGPTFCNPPKEILNQAHMEITPTGLLYFLAERSLDDCMLPSAATIFDAISETQPWKREQIWGPFYMKAFRENGGEDSDP